MGKGPLSLQRGLLSRGPTRLIQQREGEEMSMWILESFYHERCSSIKLIRHFLRLGVSVESLRV